MASSKDIGEAKKRSAKSGGEPQKNTWVTSDELRQRWELNNKASLAQYVYDYLSELPFRTISGKWVDEAWQRLCEKAMYGRIEWTNTLLKAVGGFDRGLSCRALDKEYYVGLKEVITVVDILQNLDDMLWAATVIANFEKSHNVEAEDSQQIIEQANSPTQEAPHLNDAASRRAAVQAYIDEILSATGMRITRKDIWTKAGYTSRTEFERWERCDPKRRNKSADKAFTRVLTKRPHLK